MIPSSGHQKAASGPTRSWARAEREADHVADAVLDNDIPTGHRPHADVPQAGTAAVPGVGQPLDPAQRVFFERRLGTDLASVRLHTGSAADRAAQDEHAGAYTVGEHVVLGDGADNATLAHELVHVIQQRAAGRDAVQRQEKPSTGGIGAVPPKVVYDVVDKPAPGEDARVLFPHDSVTFSATDLETLIRRLPVGRRLIIDIDGYASTEGDAEYNINLSAHRAAVLQTILARLLPDSTVQVHAHGATGAFGDPAANRRVGIRFAEAPVQLVPPLSTGGLTHDRHPRLLAEPQLHLDRGLFPSGTFPPSFDTGTAEAHEPPHLFPPRVPELPPSVLVSPKQLYPLIVPHPRSLTERIEMQQVFTSHGLAGPIDPGTDKAIDDRVTGLTQVLQENAGMTKDSARTWANRAVRNMVDRELTKQGNTIIDQSNNDITRQGGSVFLPSVDVAPYLREGLEWVQQQLKGRR
jgi:outer membrane protein OmpA-like peptidoglycan-associated protein